MIDRIDPELVSGLANTLTAHLPDGFLDVATVRAIDDQLRVETAPAAPPRVVTLEGGLELRVHGPLHGGACLLWIHGGGMFLGSARTEDAYCADLAARLGVPVVAVNYRLAPEHPHPAPLHDCRAALHWCARHAGRVVVAGGSAGGGLAAALCLLTRDEDGPPIAAAHLYYPMLDDRRDTPSARTDPPVWNRRLADLAWAAYLGGRPADALAAPARATDLRGLPPTYLDVGDLDLFRDEDAAYAARLADAGVPVRFALVPGAVHAFELIAPDAAIGRATRERRLLALAHDLNGAA
ncbi:alpha/beta hydrolase fold domain-containing protein [Dactylosporangium siamense]|uniref:Esterase n=1 Tax=Dactylosporangium siamense TaxID=685454 RepID=A0A919PKM2_9ACTN|nr:alpha/beta hydrolase fold domain-containing protein [Dactylosporangium siamense]GIG45272.1 esterase [Dactylosporangium siamense]